MQVFGFGPQRSVTTPLGTEAHVPEFRLHVQCRWRLVDGEKIVFGRDDLNYPADESISPEDFDWDKHESALDVAQRRWCSALSCPTRVIGVCGDAYGGFQVRLEGDIVLETFPCDSRRDE